MMTLLEDERLRLRFGENARANIVERFSLKGMVDEFERCFLKLCGHEGGTDEGDINLLERKVSVNEESVEVLSQGEA